MASPTNNCLSFFELRDPTTEPSGCSTGAPHRGPRARSGPEGPPAKAPQHKRARSRRPCTFCGSTASANALHLGVDGGAFLSLPGASQLADAAQDPRPLFEKTSVMGELAWRPGASERRIAASARGGRSRVLGQTRAWGFRARQEPRPTVCGVAGQRSSPTEVQTSCEDSAQS